MSDAMDEVLERLRGTGVEARGTVMPNHAPMAAEALCALGRGDAAVRWAERAREQLLPLPPLRQTIRPDHWADALGQPGRLGDWVALFRSFLAEMDPFAVVALWVPRLMPGLFAGGGHGVVRVGHAVRSTEHRVTAPRLEELATALAYWASEYRTLPGAPRLDGTRDFASAALYVPRVLSPATRTGAPRELMLHAAGSAEFTPAVEAATASADPTEALLDLGRFGARLYLDHASTQPLVFLHAVTLPASLALVLPHLPEKQRRAAVGFAWQVSAAWIATFDDHNPPMPPSADPVPSVGRLIERAVSTGDAHVFKLTEACTRLHRLTGDRAFLDAAHDYCGRVETAAHWSLARKRSAGMKFD